MFLSSKLLRIPLIILLSSITFTVGAQIVITNPPGGASITPNNCAGGEFAVGIGATGTLSCDPIPAVSIALNDILAADGAATIASGNNHSIIWNWTLTSNSVNAFAFGETAAATNGTDQNQVILNVGTLATSTAVPFYIKNYGAAVSFRIDDVSGDTSPIVFFEDGTVSFGSTSAPTGIATIRSVGNILVDGGTADVLLSNSGELGTRTNDNLGFYTNNGSIQAYFSPSGFLALERGSAPASITNASSYLKVGDTEFGANTYRIIGFGYQDPSATNLPAYVGYQEISAANNTFGDLIFGTRSVNTDTAPTERLRILNDGTINFGLTGVKLSQNDDGAITFTGLGNGNDESLTIDFDDVSPANQINFSSGSSANSLIFSGLRLWADTITVNPGLYINTGTTSNDSVVEFTYSQDNSANLASISAINLINSNGTNNTWARIGFSDTDTDAVTAAIYGMFTDTTNNFGDIIIATRSSTAFAEKMRINKEGVISFAATAPTPAVSNTSANSCGTSAATIAGNNAVGTITVGATSGTSCTVTFTDPAPVEWICMVNNATTANLVRATPTSTTVSVFSGTFVAGDLLNYMCFAR